MGEGKPKARDPGDRSGHEGDLVPNLQLEGWTESRDSE